MSDSPFQRRAKVENPIEEEELLPLPAETPVPSSPRSPVRGCGCWVLGAVWLILLLGFPCAFVTLMVEREIVIGVGDLPDEEIRIFLLNDSDNRGIGVQRPDIFSQEDGAYCLLIRTNYFLWEGDESDPLTRCNCYEKTGDAWSPVMVGGDENCQPISFDTSE